MSLLLYALDSFNSAGLLTIFNHFTFTFYEAADLKTDTLFMYSSSSRQKTAAQRSDLLKQRILLIFEHVKMTP